MQTSDVVTMSPTLKVWELVLFIIHRNIRGWKKPFFLQENNAKANKNESFTDLYILFFHKLQNIVCQQRERKKNLQKFCFAYRHALQLL
jgi:hypothetical protein